MQLLAYLLAPSKVENSSMLFLSLNMFFKFVILFTVFIDTNIQPYFETENYFKDIFKLFSKVLKIK